jgi:thiol-disulfide isomerase/thioredoxin
MGVAVGAVALVVLVGFGLLRSSSGGVSFSGDIRPGGTLRSLKLPALEGDRSFDYREHRSEPLVINFFASWCPNCAAEMPAFQDVHQRLGPRVEFLVVSQSDTRSASIALARQAGIRYLTAIDANGDFFRGTGSTGMPTTLFIRPGGRVAFVQTGALDAASLEQEIASYLGIGA